MPSYLSKVGQVLAMGLDKQLTVPRHQLVTQRPRSIKVLLKQRRGAIFPEIAIRGRQLHRLHAILLRKRMRLAFNRGYSFSDCSFCFTTSAPNDAPMFRRHRWPKALVDGHHELGRSVPGEVTKSVTSQSFRTATAETVLDPATTWPVS
jgi:hypothetical protein